MSIRTLSQQSDLFQRAADKASDALSKWLGRPSKITVNKVMVLPVKEAVGLLDVTDTPLAACVMQISGLYSGFLVLASNDSTGLALADMLLDRDIGSSTEWTEAEQSAAIETANIIGCAYLNAMATDTENNKGTPSLLPSPPWFTRDYAAAIMQSIFMSQATFADNIFLSHTSFSVDGMPGKCSLLFIPEADAQD